jgi:hypothetical protein
MRFYKLILGLFAGLFFLTFIGCNQHNVSELRTPLEKVNYSSSTSNADLVAFLVQCDSLQPAIKTAFYDLDDGTTMPLVFVTKEDKSIPKLNVFLLAQQHGNEPSGMEGILMLIRDFAEGKHAHLTEKLSLLILPQCNPSGAESHTRRTAEGIDLNRDHLLLRTAETRLIQRIYSQYKPEMTVDIHEYYPFGSAWADFGFRRNFDIQLGGLTNINVHPDLRNLFKEVALPFVKEKVEKQNFSFFEYTLGDFPDGKRLRHSTVDINDGRQSFGIAGSFSVIVEGMNGRDSLDNIKRRAQSQYATALALLEFAYLKADDIFKATTLARNELNEKHEMVSIRMDHFKRNVPLQYPLLNLRTNTDTVFLVEEYHSEVISLLDVWPPKAYLIPKSDTMLSTWLKRSGLTYEKHMPGDLNVFAYNIKAVNPSFDEETANLYPDVEKVMLKHFSADDYYYLSAEGIFKHKIITALEPQSMYGLASYPEFEYLLMEDIFPVLRVENR